ncbi:hypothetical protein N307_07019, partial [Dryobates pubescens]
AAIDCLLLAQGHGCEGFEGMCCCNLSDQGVSMQAEIGGLKNHTRAVTMVKSPLDDWLRSI